MIHLPRVALGAGFIGAPGNKLATINQTPVDGQQEQPAVSEKKWMKKAVDPGHEDYCTPMTKSTCTPRRKALAKRFKKGGDLYSGD